MGLSPPLIRAIKRKGYRLPTPIQRKTMPFILQGLDVVGMARTGEYFLSIFIAISFQNFILYRSFALKFFVVVVMR